MARVDADSFQAHVGSMQAAEAIARDRMSSLLSRNDIDIAAPKAPEEPSRDAPAHSRLARLSLAGTTPPPSNFPGPLSA